MSSEKPGWYLSLRDRVSTLPTNRSGKRKGRTQVQASAENNCRTQNGKRNQSTTAPAAGLIEPVLNEKAPRYRGFCELVIDQYRSVPAVLPVNNALEPCWPIRRRMRGFSTIPVPAQDGIKSPKPPLAGTIL